MQNQLTSLPGNGTRIRTAQGLYAGNPSYALLPGAEGIAGRVLRAAGRQAREYNILKPITVVSTTATSPDQL